MVSGAPLDAGAEPNGTSGGGGGVASKRPFKAGTCPAAVQLPMAGLQTRVEGRTWPDWMLRANWPSLKGP